MKESDRMRLLVVDACDTMARMGDQTMQTSADGMVLALLKPLTEQMLASTDGRYTRARTDLCIEDDEDETIQVY